MRPRQEENAMPNDSVPATENEAWGFWGTIRHHADPEQAWPIAIKVVTVSTCCAPAAARAFLDSRMGRHFADDVANGLARGLTLDHAIAGSASRWMGWSIGRRTARETGAPRGLPYLTAFVMAAEIDAEVAG
jgi:hypothetical protein